LQHIYFIFSLFLAYFYNRSSLLTCFKVGSTGPMAAWSDIRTLTWSACSMEEPTYKVWWPSSYSLWDLGFHKDVRTSCLYRLGYCCWSRILFRVVTSPSACYVQFL